jgi:hypothetical protein
MFFLLFLLLYVGRALARQAVKKAVGSVDPTYKMLFLLFLLFLLRLKSED